MSTFLENQKWRYATKKFDNNKKISDQDLYFLYEAIRLAPSSYGLQPYKIINVQSNELRAQLQPACWGQTQIVDASHLLVFANITDFSASDIDQAVKNIENTRGLASGTMSGYSDFIKSKITALPTEQRNTWTAKQTYIALGNLMNAAAELRIDVTPMEGFERDKVNELLGLEAMNLSASLLATIGYRSDEDQTQHNAKVRKPHNELFLTI